MIYKSSYIFLKKQQKKKNTPNDTNKIIVYLQPSFESLLRKSFEKVEFESNTSKFISCGKFVIRRGTEEIMAFFKYHNVNENIYFDISINSLEKKLAINILEDINTTLIGKNNLFNESYISIVSYDYISEYYCNKLYPYLNVFERKLRQVLFNIYTLNFNLDYYTAISSAELQTNIKLKSESLNKEINELNNQNTSKDDAIIKYAFYSLDYHDIDKLLFTKYFSNDMNIKLQEFLTVNKDLTKLTDKELRNAFKSCQPKTNWEIFFLNKKVDDNFQEIFDDIRKFRNSVAHCKIIRKDQYVICIKLLKKSIKELETAISITEERDFLLKNLDQIKKSSEKLLKMLSEVLITYKAPINNLILTAGHLKKLNLQSNLIDNSTHSIVSVKQSILLPKILKNNIQNHFNIFETENQKGPIDNN